MTDIRTVADLADVMGLTEQADLELLHYLAKCGPTGPASLCVRFHVFKRAAQLAPKWTLPPGLGTHTTWANPFLWPPYRDAPPRPVTTPPPLPTFTPHTPCP